MIWMGIRLLGMLLIVMAGGGVGLSLYWQKRMQWRRIGCLIRLLEYLLVSIQYQAIPGEELLHRAANRPEFAPLRLQACDTFAQIPLPPGLDAGTREELSQGLARLAELPHTAACQTLERLVALCRSTEQDACQAARQAGALYPKLGFCMGLMAAIFFA